MSKNQRYKVVVTFKSDYVHEAPCYNEDIAKEQEEVFLKVVNVKTVKVKKIDQKEYDNICQNSL